MNEQSPRVVCVGEVAVELFRVEGGHYALACNGDTFNTAVYLARAGIDVSHASAIGDDPYSEGIVAVAAAEDVRHDTLLRVPGRLPGLAMVEFDSAGHRHVYTWDEAAPARELFELSDWTAVAERLLSAHLIYFTGVTLSLYSNTGLGRFLAVIETARQNGTKVAFDGNFRPRRWRGDLGRTRTVVMEALKRVDIAMPAYDDEAVLWGDPSPEATLERIQAFGVAEVVIKNGPNSALVSSAGKRDFVAVPEVVVPVDATAAGDSFNAAYLAARLRGIAPFEAAEAAHRLAAEVIRHPGALMPRADAAVH
jgi:2-dehydro-3-deoxygluconokinase